MPQKKHLALAAFALLFLVIGASGAGLFTLWQYTKTVKESDVGRGFGVGVPTFSGDTGSTQSNISRTLAVSEQTGVADALGGGGLGTTTTSLSKTPRLWQPLETPVGGLSFSRSEPVAYGVDKATGNVFRIDPRTGEVERLTNTLIPFVQEAVWVNDRTVILRSLDDRGEAATFLGSIPPATSSPPHQLSGQYLAKGITTVAPSEKGDGFFYIEPLLGEGVFAGIISDSAHKRLTRVWESPVGSWKGYWYGEKVFLHQHAAQAVTGSVYVVDTKTRRSLPLVSGVAGLSAATHKDGLHVLYSESYLGSYTLHLKTPTGVRRLPLRTLGEKCVWSAKGELVAYCAVPQEPLGGALPDAWYRGEVHSQDTWWKVDATTGQVDALASVDFEYGTGVDVRTPLLSPDDAYITFIDGVTGRGWIFRLAL